MTGRIWDIGRDLQSRVKGFFENPPGPDATPLELLQATLDQLEGKVQPAGRGRRVFPYDRIAVRIFQPGADAIAIQAIFGQLEQRLRDRLAELRCEAPDSIVTAAVLVEVPDTEGQPLLTVDCFSERIESRAPAPPSNCPSITLTVVKGQCAVSEYVFQEPVISIGRLAEPADALGQIRVNHVVFLDVRDGVNETVGRAHAKLQYDAGSGHFHLFNESSSNPTSIVRGGKSIRVAPRDPRGVRVLSGDQLQLGRAALLVTVRTPPF